MLTRCRSNSCFNAVSGRKRYNASICWYRATIVIISSTPATMAAYCSESLVAT